MIKTETLQAFFSEIKGRRNEVIDDLLKFFMTDMMFFWGEEKGLIEKQEEVWGPLLKWGEEEFNTKFAKAKGLNVPEQDMQSGYRMKFFMEGLSDNELTVFYYATYTMKSVLLAAAFVKKRITPVQACDAALLEEVWQQSIWGRDEESDKKHEELRKGIKKLADFLK